MAVGCEVAFHFNAPDKVQYAARLLRKALSRGHRLLVLVDGDDLMALDSALWTIDPGSFIPHARHDDAESIQRRSPILLWPGAPADANADVLVNLRHQWVAEWSRFSKVVEVVTEAEDDRAAARERWRYYRQHGVEPVRHDLAARAA